MAKPWTEKAHEKKEERSGLMSEKTLYTVSYFNPIANEDCTVRVIAECPLEAAFIAHAQLWTSQREFDFEDYNVNEFSLDQALKLSDVKWPDMEALTTLKKAMEDYIIKNWKASKDYYPNHFDEFVEECNSQFPIEKSSIIEILTNAGFSVKGSC